MERDSGREIRDHQSPCVETCRWIVKEVKAMVAEAGGDKDRTETREQRQTSGQLRVRRQRRHLTSVKLNHDAARLIVHTPRIVDDQPEIRDRVAESLVGPPLAASIVIFSVERDSGAVRV